MSMAFYGNSPLICQVGYPSTVKNRIFYNGCQVKMPVSCVYGRHGKFKFE